MPGARDDHLLRLIQQAAAALKLFRERLAGGEAPDRLSRDISAALGALLGPQRPVLERLDGWSAANLIGDTERVQLWSEHLALQSEAEHTAGRVANAVGMSARAVALATHGVKRPC